MDPLPAGDQPTLRGAGLRLRPWRDDDADAVAAACQDPEIQRWTTVPVPYRHEDAAFFVGPLARQTWAEGGALFAVEGAGGLLGSMGLHHLVDGLGAVGYWTVPAARGRGVTSEALRVLSRWLLTERGAVRVELVAEPANTGSCRVAERAGFRREGVLRSRMLLRGERVDVAMYSLLPADLLPGVG
ncbi:GNAT family N-acetyltransferase [Modestobacter sp. I12A-02628]|uniref:GNAT family N-acetyltransferase n=1 Tax=Goekera deserti TaxID=2497753 RepID=A0A7K3WLG4_9ACTN|nr:GNAT family protein [Goekera deserti]MPQ97076.1 GNAT family N-acetyltransferase [Goekera deserti]NDI46607.1 GNAT family N-acetyltransferase [Goekera deserti]NEL56363.1 GNAT family N-acetyltransferase [Goekera deserti]